jgi:hypothetical protein
MVNLRALTVIPIDIHWHVHQTNATPINCCELPIVLSHHNNQLIVNCYHVIPWVNLIRDYDIVYAYAYTAGVGWNYAPL